MPEPATTAALITSGGQLLQGLLSSLMNSGNSKASRRAMEQQMKLATALVNIAQQQHKQGSAQQGQVFDALNRRAAQQHPRFLPGRPQTFNPLAQRNQVRATEGTAGGSTGRIAPQLLQLLQGR